MAKAKEEKQKQKIQPNSTEYDDVISLMFTILLLLGVKFTVINPSNKIHKQSFF